MSVRIEIWREGDVYGAHVDFAEHTHGNTQAATLPELFASLAEVFALVLEDTDPAEQAAMFAPEDDEPLTPEDDAAMEKADAELAAGKGIPHEKVVRMLDHDEPATEEQQEAVRKWLRGEGPDPWDDNEE